MRRGRKVDTEVEMMASLHRSMCPAAPRHSHSRSSQVQQGTTESNSNNPKRFLVIGYVWSASPTPFFLHIEWLEA